MNAWKVIFATLVIFVAGMVTGGLLVSYSNRAPQKHQRSWPHDLTNRWSESGRPAANWREALLSPGMPGARPQGLRRDFLQKLDRELQFTAEQRAQIEKIITEGQERNRQLWNRVLPEMRQEMKATKERIYAVLKPDQIKRFEELMKQRPQRKSDDPLIQPERRLRDQPRPPTEPPANP